MAAACLLSMDPLPLPPQMLRYKRVVRSAAANLVRQQGVNPYSFSQLRKLLRTDPNALIQEYPWDDYKITPEQALANLARRNENTRAGRKENSLNAAQVPSSNDDDKLRLKLS